MKKYIVKEINSEYNDIFFDSLKDDLTCNFSHDILIGLNRDYNGTNDDLLKHIKDNIIDYSSYVVESYYRNNIASYIIDNMSYYKKLSLKQALSIAKVVKNYSGYRGKDEYRCYCDILSIVFCKEYDYTILRGYCQSDWIVCFYAKEIDFAFIQYIEAVYFNTGKDIYISCEKIEIDDIQSIDDFDYDGYCDYIVDYFFDKDIKESIAANIGCKVDEIALYTIKDIKTVKKDIITYNEMR